MGKRTQSRGARSTIKAISIAVLLLLLLIPLFFIQSLIEERERQANVAEMDIISGAGDALELMGPILVMPYEIEATKKTDEGWHTSIQRGEVYLLPETVAIDGQLAVEYRSRGIYRVPVYSAEVDIDGEFAVPGPAVYPDGALPRPEGNRLIMGIGDMRGIREVTPLNWRGDTIDFSPDSVPPDLGKGGIAATVGRLPAVGTRLDFSWAMDINGGGKVVVVPLGRDSSITLEGDWPSPSFIGSVLPDERELDETSFKASWRIPEVSRPMPAHWNSETKEVTDFFPHTLAVKLLEPVSTYSRVERSVKYGFLFLLIPFVVFFLFEILGGLRVHPVQYLLAGAADVVFYLILLAVSEHLDFGIAYLIAALAVSCLISIYALSITGGQRKALAMPVVLGGAYLWLWVTLQSEDYALLIGSLGLFVIIAAVMLLTRKVNWYEGRPSPDEDKTSGDIESA